MTILLCQDKQQVVDMGFKRSNGEKIVENIYSSHAQRILTVWNSLTINTVKRLMLTKVWCSEKKD